MKINGFSEEIKVISETKLLGMGPKHRIYMQECLQEDVDPEEDESPQC